MFGKADMRIAQADVSHLKAIKAAILDPPAKPNHEDMLGALGAAGLVAYEILHSGQSWSMPATVYGLLVLFAVVLNAYQAVARYIKAYSSNTATKIALALLNDMIAQIEPVTGAPAPDWWRFLSRGQPPPQIGPAAHGKTAQREVQWVGGGVAQRGDAWEYYGMIRCLGETIDLVKDGTQLVVSSPDGARRLATLSLPTVRDSKLEPDQLHYSGFGEFEGEQVRVEIAKEGAAKLTEAGIKFERHWAAALDVQRKS